MDRPEEAVESVNPREQELSASEPSESNVPNEPTEGLLRISQDMARVLDRLTALKALIDTVRRHGVEEFHGLSMEESTKAKFWLEKLERVLEEVRCPPDQRTSCAVSLLHSEAYDWWKLVFKSPGIPNPMTWELYHTPIPDSTRMAYPKRVRGMRLSIGTLIDLFFLRAELVPVGIQTISVITKITYIYKRTTTGVVSIKIYTHILSLIYLYMYIFY